MSRENRLLARDDPPSSPLAVLPSSVAPRGGMASDVVTREGVTLKRPATASSVPFRPSPDTDPSILAMRQHRDEMKEQARKLLASYRTPSTGLFDIVEQQSLWVQGRITVDRLKRLCGETDLNKVTSFELRISAEEHNLDDLGNYLPSLEELRLEDSHIPTFRDLGLGLRNLRLLSISRCGLLDLDGVTEALPNLEELYASHNQLTDLMPLAYHPNIRVLQLQGNKISDLDMVDWLGSLPKLANLVLKGNAIAARKHYRRLVCTRFSGDQLQSLDGVFVSAADREPVPEDEEEEVDDAALQQAAKERDVILGVRYSTGHRHTHQVAAVVHAGGASHGPTSGSAKAPSVRGNPGTAATATTTATVMNANTGAGAGAGAGAAVEADTDNSFAADKKTMKSSRVTHSDPEQDCKISTEPPRTGAQQSLLPTTASAFSTSSSSSATATTATASAPSSGPVVRARPHSAQHVPALSRSVAALFASAAVPSRTRSSEGESSMAASTSSPPSSSSNSTSHHASSHPENDSATTVVASSIATPRTPRPSPPPHPPTTASATAYATANSSTAAKPVSLVRSPRRPHSSDRLSLALGPQSISPTHTSSSDDASQDTSAASSAAAPMLSSTSFSRASALRRRVSSGRAPTPLLSSSVSATDSPLLSARVGAATVSPSTVSGLAPLSTTSSTTPCSPTSSTTTATSAASTFVPASSSTTTTPTSSSFASRFYRPEDDDSWSEASSAVAFGIEPSDLRGVLGVSPLASTQHTASPSAEKVVTHTVKPSLSSSPFPSTSSTLSSSGKDTSVLRRPASSSSSTTSSMSSSSSSCSSGSLSAGISRDPRVTAGPVSLRAIRNAGKSIIGSVDGGIKSDGIVSNSASASSSAIGTGSVSSKVGGSVGPLNKGMGSNPFSPLLKDDKG